MSRPPSLSPAALRSRRQRTLLSLVITSLLFFTVLLLFAPLKLPFQIRLLMTAVNLVAVLVLLVALKQSRSPRP